MPYFRTSAAWLLLALFFGCSNDARVGDESVGARTATAEQLEDLCAALCDSAQRCTSGSDFDECWLDCKSGLDPRRFNGAFVETYRECLDRATCPPNEEASCLALAYQALPTHSTYDACARMRATRCQDVGDTYCPSLLGLSVDNLALASECMDLPCAQVEGCIRAAGVYGH